jgi:transcriptional regulator NrdR family protein
MNCPSCNLSNSNVIDSRPCDLGVKRRRKCVCGNKWTTYELAMDKKQFEKLTKKESRTGTPWTEQQDDELQFLYEEGYTLKEIGEEIGRTPESVDKRIRRLGLRRKRSLEKINDLLDNPDLVKVLKEVVGK